MAIAASLFDNRAAAEDRPNNQLPAATRDRLQLNVAVIAWDEL